MGLFGPQRRDFFGITGAQDLIPTRATGGIRQVGSVVVSDDKALRHSAVWACLRLRASLISTFPLKVYRDVLGMQVEWATPTVLTDPGGVRMDLVDWMAASQLDLDRSGNAVGLIVERSAYPSPLYPTGLPTRIELQPAATCSYHMKPGKPDMWRINGKFYALEDVWHERQYVLPGMPLGLNPVTYAALSIGEYLSLQQYGLDWFANGGIPKAHMKNQGKRLAPQEITTAKQWYADTIQGGDLLVTGNDWEYNMIQAMNAGMEWIEGRRFGLGDICRFFDVPADLIDASSSNGGSITYANITQRNLQFLIHHLGPTVTRREKNLSKLLPTSRYVKLNTDALLRMDPQTRQEVIKSRLESRVLAIDEARALENLPMLTQAQKDDFVDVYGEPKKISHADLANINTSPGTAAPAATAPTGGAAA
jgi:HK97 family phage portal protein